MTTKPEAVLRLETALAHIEAQEAEIELLKKHLIFFERWANHHAQKPHMTPEQALSCIQHYPPILAITRSYANGKVPKTRNPWAELEAALAELALAKDAELKQAAPAQADSQMQAVPAAWMTTDGRVATNETKEKSMSNSSKVVFTIPLYMSATHWMLLSSPPDAYTDQAAQAAQIKDSERYRWLRNNGTTQTTMSLSPDEDANTVASVWHQIPEVLDAAIDAAIAASKGAA